MSETFVSYIPAIAAGASLLVVMILLETSRSLGQALLIASLYVISILTFFAFSL